MAPKLPRNFDEVILSQQNGGKFSWATVAHNTDLKARLLPLSSDIPPDYGEYAKLWQENGGKIVPTNTASAA